MTARLNKAGREIWFDRILWSWMPCHWKGWAMLATIIIAGNTFLWTLICISSAMNMRDAGWPFLIIFPFVGLGWWVAERHSPSREDG
jgi:hypothetical protein